MNFRHFGIGIGAVGIAATGFGFVDNNGCGRYGYRKRAQTQQKAKEAVKKFMVVNGIPGVSVGVTVDGATVWRRGFGYADVEGGAKCTGDTVMRVASISKPITAAAVARAVDARRLHLDASIHKYLTPEEFPAKTVDGEAVDITVRQLLPHTGGIRHYTKAQYLNNKNNTNTNNDSNVKNKELDERKLNKKFASVSEALKLFAGDDLVARPGTKYFYTTHGYTLVAAVLEKVAEGGQTFPALLKELFTQLGMHHTALDENSPIVPHRASYYKRNNRTHRLENVPQVDTSYKWAGGGLISNVADLLLFANAMLYSSQSNAPAAFLRRDTVARLWRSEVEVPGNREKSAKSSYGLGWVVVESEIPVGGVPSSANSAYCFHSGAGVGASSILLIKPSAATFPTIGEKEGGALAAAPRGVCVAILANCQDAGGGIVALARQIAQIFEEEFRN